MDGRDLLRKALDTPIPKTIEVSIKFNFDGEEVTDWLDRLDNGIDELLEAYFSLDEDSEDEDGDSEEPVPKPPSTDPPADTLREPSSAGDVHADPHIKPDIDWDCLFSKPVPSTPADDYVQPPTRKRQREHANWVGHITYPDGTESPPFGPGDLDAVYRELTASKEPVCTHFTAAPEPRVQANRHVSTPAARPGFYNPHLGYAERDSRGQCYTYPDDAQYCQYWPGTGTL